MTSEKINEYYYLFIVDTFKLKKLLRKEDKMAKAVRIHETGGPEVLEWTETAPPRSDGASLIVDLDAATAETTG